MRWIRAQELDRWASSNDARVYLPELMRRLVHATIDSSDLEHIDFPAGEETHRPGYDGETKTQRGNAWVPQGIAYWELSTEAAVTRKLEKDYETRLAGRGAGDFTEVTYVAVTAHGYKNKKAWARDKRALGEWGDVRVYDSSDLEQWLEVSPGVALWLLRHLGKSADDLLDLSTHWDNLHSQLRRPLRPDVLLLGREEVAQAIRSWVGGSPDVLTIEGASPHEIVDVFAAWATGLAEPHRSAVLSRTVLVETAGAWRGLLDSSYRLVLVPAGRMEPDSALIAEAKRKGHHVLLPQVSSGSGRPEAARLNRLDRTELEKALRADGLTEQEAYTLAQHSGGSFQVLKRQFSSLPGVTVPSWARDRDAAELAPLVLVGSWDGDNNADKEVVTRVAARPYGYIAPLLARLRVVSDAPLRWANGIWEFVSPLDAYTLLRSFLHTPYLAAFEAAACEILATDDPRLELPRDERWQARVRGKHFAHSEKLRLGLARTLALLATTDERAAIPDTLSLQARANRIITTILPRGASWQRWASLGTLLPTLAEAAPEAVLDAAESCLVGTDPELPKLFAEEGHGLTAFPEHTGLLWALERLAWPPHLLARATAILATLAEHDPGGTWANRPQASLRDIFFSWMPHTAAPLDQRLAVLEALLDRHPTVGWKLLLELLPHSHESIMEHPTPEWRPWAEGWKRGAARVDHMRTVRAFIELALAGTAASPKRWIDLVPHLNSWPRDDLEKALAALDHAPEAGVLTASERLSLWRVLRDETHRHRYFTDADWALAPDAVVRLEAVRDALAPADPVDVAVPLFGSGPNLFGPRSLSFEDQQALRQQQREQVVLAVLNQQGLAGIRALLDRTDNPWDVGIAVASASEERYDAEILPGWLSCGDRARELFARYYATRRIRREGREWAERLPSEGWGAGDTAALAAAMPFDARTWDFVARLGPHIEAEYWRRSDFYEHGLRRSDIERAARGLIAARRPAEAIRLLSMTADEPAAVAPALLLELLELALAAPSAEGQRHLEFYEIDTLLECLQTAADIDANRVARLEWNLLPPLGRHSRQPQVLHQFIARDPDFFVELLTAVYRPEDDTEDRGDTEAPPPDEAARRRAERAWHLLHNWQRVPGTQPDGSIDGIALWNWVATARAKALSLRRLTVCDVSIGQVFAHAPPDPDDSWPCTPVRDAIEAVNSRHLENGFEIGIMNKRGTYSKSRDEGGRQERALAETYQRHADVCDPRWPRTAGALRRVAADYREQARREDQEADADR